jgi:hypothetical protein
MMASGGQPFVSVQAPSWFSVGTNIAQVVVSGFEYLDPSVYALTDVSGALLFWV